MPTNWSIEIPTDILLCLLRLLENHSLNSREWKCCIGSKCAIHYIKWTLSHKLPRLCIWFHFVEIFVGHRKTDSSFQTFTNEIHIRTCGYVRSYFNKNVKHCVLFHIFTVFDFWFGVEQIHIQDSIKLRLTLHINSSFIDKL